MGKTEGGAFLHRFDTGIGIQRGRHESCPVHHQGEVSDRQSMGLEWSRLILQRRSDLIASVQRTPGEVPDQDSPSAVRVGSASTLRFGIDCSRGGGRRESPHRQRRESERRRPREEDRQRELRPTNIVNEPLAHPPTSSAQAQRERKQPLPDPSNRRVVK